VLWPSLIGSLVLEMMGLSEHVTYFATPIKILLGYFVIVQFVYLLRLLFKKLGYEK
jgi:hypothetical protein